MANKLFRVFGYVVCGGLVGIFIVWCKDGGRDRTPLSVFGNSSGMTDINANESARFPLTLDGDYILNSPKLCSDIPTVKALVVVHTAVHHFTRRHNIRSTFGSRDLFKEVRVVFLLGLVNDVKIQESIQREHIKYGDTVQGNFIDSYHNLTHKGVMGLRWITEHCSNVKYVVKVDDDVIFDMWRFLNYFGSFSKGRSIFCNVIKNGWIFRKGKWKLDNEIFYDRKRWPWPYCPGFVVILSGDVIKPLFEAAYMTPYIWIDDVYLYGYLPFQARGINIQNFPKHHGCSSGKRSHECLLKNGDNCTHMAVNVPENKYQMYWNLIKKRNKKT
ncbi:beta-1,3-galactosyltransferase 1 [Patella vulgata]|uniref:beta-1,3-galactosyltransferase 1 n=1 Tax=Patella vulgata TaxID=6465 RepID=UPI00218078E0|nr:beta-1,3-galactosyltransferase 1 [Patella vulgata]